jgi:hypothetical protein
MSKPALINAYKEKSGFSGKRGELRLERGLYERKYEIVSALACERKNVVPASARKR